MPDQMVEAEQMLHKHPGAAMDLSLDHLVVEARGHQAVLVSVEMEVPTQETPSLDPSLLLMAVRVEWEQLLVVTVALVVVVVQVIAVLAEVGTLAVVVEI